jgi:spermidine synthase
MRWLLIGCIFVLSGAAGLVYEIVWFRRLAVTFGGTGPAVAATTAAFMAGLGLGSFLAGRLADRLRRPLLIFAALESLIAVSASVLPFAIAAVESLLLSAFGTAESTLASNGFLFVAVFAILLAPTALMGATLPVLCCALIRRGDQLGRGFTWLYGLNTSGACAGAAIAGFWLIPTLGVSATGQVAMLLNLCASLGAVMLWWGSRNVAHESPPIPDSPNSGLAAQPVVSVSLICFAVFCSGFASLAAQYHWTRCLLFSFDRLKNTTYSFSAVLSVTLAGLVVGSIIVYSVIDRLPRPDRVFAVSLMCLGGSIVSSVGLLFALPPIVDAIHPVTLQVDFSGAVKSVALRTMLVTGIPTVLMGFTLPLAVRCVTAHRQMGAAVGSVYAWNTLGAVAGAIFAAWLLTPMLGLTRGLILLGALPIAAGALTLLAGRRYVRGVCCLATAGLVIVLYPLNAVSWSLQSLRPNEQLLRYVDGAMASVAVIESADGTRRICVDDVPVAGTSNVMQTDQKSLAHWSVLLSANPKRALTVGFGSGGASWSFLLHDRLETVHCVEICPNVPRAADLLTEANHRLLQQVDPRYRVVIADARAWLRSTPQQYDIVVSDCTDLRYRSSANLYDYEYFQLCHDALRDGGCTVIWMPLGGLSPESFRMTLRTFVRVYPEAMVFYLHNRWTHYVLLVGHRGSFRIAPQQVRDLLSESDVRADMAEIGMAIPEKVIATFLTSANEIRWMIEGDELNTEDMPRLEFAVPRYDMGPWSAQRNLNMLRDRRGSVANWLASDTTSEDVAAIQRYAMAAEYIMEAQQAERVFDIEGATVSYLLALEQTPEDEAIVEALTFPVLRKLQDRGAPTAWLLMARSLQLQKKLEAALSQIDGFESAKQKVASPTTLEESEWRDQAEAWSQTAQQWRREIVAQLAQ